MAIMGVYVAYISGVQSFLDFSNGIIHTKGWFRRLNAVAFVAHVRNAEWPLAAAS